MTPTKRRSLPIPAALALILITGALTAGAGTIAIRDQEAHAQAVERRVATVTRQRDQARRRLARANRQLDRAEVVLTQASRALGRCAHLAEAVSQP